MSRIVRNLGVRTRLAGAVLLVVGLACAGVAQAHLDHGAGYSFKDDSCALYNGSGQLRYADPITAVMVGTGANSHYNVQGILNRKVGWEDRAWENEQWYWDHGDCKVNNVQGSDVPIFTAYHGPYKNNRWHVRGRTQEGHPKGQNWTVMTPHRDVWINRYQDASGTVRCKGVSIGPYDANGTHYVHKQNGNGSGFDRGREALVQRLRPYFVSRVNWGNTQTMKQCNMQKAGANGYVAYFRVPK